MNRDGIQMIVREELGNIAPEINLDEVDRAADLHEALDIDSMDFLNFIMALHRRLGVDVPEIDYRKLATIEGAVAYLVAKTKSTSVDAGRQNIGNGDSPSSEQ